MTTAVAPARADVARMILGPEGIGLKLSPEFLECLLPHPREKVVVGGPQGGKSTNDAAEVMLDISRPLDRRRQHLYWVVLPSFKSERTEMEYLRDWGKKLGVLNEEHFPQNDQAMIRLFNGLVKVETKTGQDPAGIAGEPCDGIVMVEAGQVPETVRHAAITRLTTYRGWLRMSGTLENDEGKPQWAWFGKLAEEWRAQRDDEHGAWSLPTWANRSAFPGGYDEPEIARLRGMYSKHDFDRRYAAIPSGVANPVYPQLVMPGYLTPIPPGHDVWVPSFGATGMDYGALLGHPSAVVAITVNIQDEAWVRECWVAQTGDTHLIDMVRLDMSARYGISPDRCSEDPMLKAHADYVGTTTAKTGAGARMARTGVVGARLNARKLFFDLNGRGVPEAFEEMKRVHLTLRLVPGAGEVWDYARIADDRPAAIENAIELIDWSKKNPWSGWEAQKGLSTPTWASRRLRVSG